MATLQLQATISATLFPSSSLSSSSSIHSTRIRASLLPPFNSKPRQIPNMKIFTITKTEELSSRGDHHSYTYPNQRSPTPPLSGQDDAHLLSRVLAIAEAAADRAEMHAIIGEQRDNWGHHFLSSINSLTLAASLMAGVSAIPVADDSPHLLALKLSSGLLFVAATGMMALTNKIQPSQLAEEQRNATRLFKQLEKSIHTALALRPPTEADVEEVMERVLALDKAYPLPLLPGMLEKFPETVEPTVWWPSPMRRRQRSKQSASASEKNTNGWSKELEEEMRGVLRLIRKNDTNEYLHFGKKILEMNKRLAVLGPLLGGAAAAGTALIGSSPALGPWPALVAVAGGAMAAVVNTLEHGGQAGMVFELCRNCAGFYRQLEEEIELNLGEKELERRENGDLFEMKVALKLGRSLSEMKGLRLYATSHHPFECEEDGDDITELAGKLF